MLKKISFIFLVFCVAIISGCSKTEKQENNNAEEKPEVTQNNENKDDGFIVGGPCSYDTVKGNCKILTVVQTDDSKKQEEIDGGPEYAGYDIKFSFIPDNEEDLAGRKVVLRKENTLRLTNSWYPGEEYIAKYNIKDDAIFKCELNLISSGTCSPMVYEFENIDTTDYFETKE